MRSVRFPGRAADSQDAALPYRPAIFRLPGNFEVGNVGISSYRRTHLGFFPSPPKRQLRGVRRFWGHVFTVCSLWSERVSRPSAAAIRRCTASERFSPGAATASTAAMIFSSICRQTDFLPARGRAGEPQMLAGTVYPFPPASAVRAFIYTFIQAFVFKGIFWLIG